MALVPFSYANHFTDQLQLKERLFTINKRLIRIRQAWKGDGKGGTEIGFGASVYPAAFVLAEYVERHPYLVEGKRVIELGTGTGFLGIAAAVLGAAEVCLTDGDEESLRLAESNVRDNSSLIRGHRRLHEPAEGAGGHPLWRTRREGGAISGVNECASWGPEGMRASHSDDLSIPGEEHGDLKDATQARRDSDGDHLLEHITIGCTHHRSAADGSNKEEAADGSSSGPSAESSNQQQDAPVVSVRKLRWGSSADIKACCSRGGGGYDNRVWDVVLGSDIAALPYASAYGDLLQTIMSLVYQNHRSTVEAGSSEEILENVIGHGGNGCSTNSSSRGFGEPRRVLVLLAHKRRHVSEDAFFDAVRQELVGKGCAVTSCRQLGDDDVHADFRGMGIRLHSFTVDVR